jgi:hemin uptake protein HemP
MHSRDDREAKSGPVPKGDEQVDPNAGRSATSVEEIATIEAATLLGARGLVHIVHAGQIYTLRVTRNDRLILTK